MPEALVLPYITEDRGRKKLFSKNMELAALLCFAGAERKKKGGLLGREGENITALSRLYYPLWAIPCEGRSLLLDGMKVVSNTVSYAKPPDAEAFIEHLRRSTSVEELYRSTLRTHTETFSDFTSQTEITVEGFIAEKEFLSETLILVQASKRRKPIPVSNQALVPPRIDEKDAVKIGKRVQMHYNQLKSEMKGLTLVIDTITKETEKHAGKLKLELEQLSERFNDEISALKMEVDEKTAELEKERTEKVQKITTLNEREMDSRLAEKEKLEKELLKLEQNESEYEKRKELRKRKGDEIGEARWNTRLRDIQGQIRTTEGRIKALSDFISRSNKETEKATKRLNNTYSKLIQEEEKKVTDLENMRNVEINKKEGQISGLKKETETIAKKVEGLMDRKQEQASSLDGATLAWKPQSLTLLYLPFYLIQYEAGNKRRYCLRSPALARGRGGLVMKIRKTLRSYSLQSKIGTLLTPRSRAIEKLFIILEKKAKSDTGLRRMFSQLSITNNQLTSKDFKDRAAQGMEELQTEGWIKPEEATAILDECEPSQPGSVNS